jgi:CelD/BcsL family acetyltransferase involved in cellulose biosynthesis
MPLEFNVHCIHNAEELNTLSRDWHRLWLTDPIATPFQNPAWLLPWWNYLGQGDLFAISVRCRDQLVGLLPTYIYSDQKTGCRKVLPLGTGTTDYLGGVFDPATAPTVIRLIYEKLRLYQDDWDEAHLYQLPPSSPLLSEAERMNSYVVATQPCWRFTLPGGGEFHGKLRQNIAYYKKRARRIGNLSCAVANESSCLDLFERLTVLHSRRWQQRGTSGVLSCEAVQQAHRAAIPRLQSAGLLRMISFSIDHNIVAVLYALIDAPAHARRTLYCYLEGFDPDFAECSPGTLLLNFAFEHASDEGVAEVDFLRGDERYKRFWKAIPHPTYGVTLSNRSRVPSARQAHGSSFATLKRNSDNQHNNLARTGLPRQPRIGKAERPEQHAPDLPHPSLEQS